MVRYRWALSFALTCALSIALYADGPNFVADHVFNDKTLHGWKSLGSAQWKVENGEIVGTPDNSGGGWLILDQSFQDVAFYASLVCPSGCKAGVLLRAEKTPGGMKGIFVSLSDDDRASYAITLDPQGKEVSREKLQPTPGTENEGGLANVMGNVTPERMAFMRQPSNRPLPIPAGLNLPQLQPPTTTYQSGDWNQINIIAYQDMLDPVMGGTATTQTLQDRVGLQKCAAPAQFGSYGPIALYVGGSAAARFKDVRYKDLNTITTPKEYLSPDFTVAHINRYYVSWGIAAVDVNHDGVLDIVAGPYYYLGPDFTEAHEIYTPKPYNPATDYPQNSMITLAADFTGDGWPDVLVVSGSAGIGLGTLYVNPRGESRHWDHFDVIPRVGNEDAQLAKLFGDDRIQVIHSGNNRLQYSMPDPKDPTGPWITTDISEPGPWGANIVHGMGVGDINGDGRLDILTVYGWWEQPPKGSHQLWTYHPEQFGRWGHSQGGAGGATLGIYDVNGDGLNDVVTSLEGHGVGLGWFEQKRDSAGKITFIPHLIMDSFLTKNAGDVTFTQAHGAAFADMDGDGIPDFITGKRVMAHLFSYRDPDPFGPGVLYIYRTVRNKKAPGGAEFVPMLVNNYSGISGTAIVDLNGDGTPDIATSGVQGTYIFFNHIKKSGPAQGMH
jgi:hypothetical protein